MGKTEAKNLDLKSKLSIALDTITDAEKDIEPFKKEFNDFKRDHTMSKKGLNFLNNEGLIINNDTLITKTNCIKLKSVVRENINLL